MRAIAQTLNAQDAMADLGAYFETHSGAPALPSAPGAVQRRLPPKTVKAGCPACHGANFNKPIGAGYRSWPASTPTTCTTPCAYPQDKAFIGRATR